TAATTTVATTTGRTPAPSAADPGPAAAAKPPAAAKPVTALTPELKTTILEAMRLNRQTFQEDAVLERYGESRPPVTLPALVASGLARPSDGGPAAQYPATQARSTPRPYTEVKVVDCL